MSGRTFHGYRAPRHPPPNRLKLSAPPGGDTLPDVLDLRPLCGPARNQGSEGSCTGHAWRGAVYCLSVRAVNDRVRNDPFEASPAWIYWRERQLEGTTHEDAGASIGDGARVVAWGVCPEYACPYLAGDFATPPGDAADAAATVVRVEPAEALENDLATLRAVLAQGFPIVAGIRVCGQDLDSEAVAATGDVPMPSGDTPEGHAILLVGHDRVRRLFHWQNSWGPEWGDRGFGTIPEEYVLRADLCPELFVARVLT